MQNNNKKGGSIFFLGHEKDLKTKMYLKDSDLP